MKSKWDLKNSVNKIELQLAELKFNQKVKTDLISVNDMFLIQKHLIKTIMTLLRKILKKKFHWHNAVINTVAVYCRFQKEKNEIWSHEKKRTVTKKISFTSVKEICSELMIMTAEKQTLSVTMLLVFKKKRLTICFLCLEKKNLLFKKQVYLFAHLKNLTKHFKQKHLINYKED